MPKISKLENPEIRQFGKFRKFAIRKIPSIVNSENSKKFQSENSKNFQSKNSIFKFSIWKIPKTSN